MTLKALIFDFDGLILDTETPEYQAWQEIYAQHGSFLPLSEWTRGVGSSAEAFDPVDYLAKAIGRPLDPAALRVDLRTRTSELLRDLDVQPGILAYLEGARARGIRLGVASSSPAEWVCGHLKRLGLVDHFDQICTSEDVEKVKPDPALYRLAMARLEAQPCETVALEDSLNGIMAARRAGMFCVCVPNEITRSLDLSEADLIVPSLADLPLDDLIARCENRVCEA